jgi:C1A family cysteine protease
MLPFYALNFKEELLMENRTYSLGWLRDYPSIRDLNPTSTNIPSRLQALGKTDSVNGLLEQTGVLTANPAKLPGEVDLRPSCSEIKDQGRLGSCTAHAGVGLVEYFENRAFGQHIDASRLFLYKATRNLMKTTGDTGAFLRTTMQALVIFGVPPEAYYPYIIPEFEQEPSAFLYAFAQSYSAISYYRLDPSGTPKSELLNRIKTYLATGLPSMFGFTCYSSLFQQGALGKIPFPSASESVEGGHAIVAVGYDDNLKIKNTSPGGIETTGALLIRNSWGEGWGEKGYGWLPYEYVLSGLATDWWSMIKGEWVDTGQFQLGD